MFEVHSESKDMVIWLALLVQSSFLRAVRLWLHRIVTTMLTGTLY